MRLFGMDALTPSDMPGVQNGSHCPLGITGRDQLLARGFDLVIAEDEPLAGLEVDCEELAANVLAA